METSSQPSEDQSVRKAGRHRGKPVGLFEGRGANDHAVDSDVVEHGDDARLIANPAAQLTGDPHGVEDGPNRFEVDRLSRLGSIEVDQMQPFGPGLGPFPRHLGRIAKHGFAGIVALTQPDGLAAPQINRR